MGNTSVTKVQSKHSPTGEMGQKYLASGVSMAMRLWENEPPGAAKPTAVRAYETVGYVIAGRAELHIEGQEVLLEPGDIVYVPFTPYRTLVKYADLILKSFVQTIAINEGARAVSRNINPVGVNIGVGGS